MAPHKYHFLYAVAAVGAASAMIALQIWPASLRDASQRPGAGKSDRLLTLRSLPEVPEIPLAVPTDSLPVIIAAGSDGEPAPGDAPAGGKNNDPAQPPEAKDIPADADSTTAAPTAGSGQKTGAITYGNYSGRIGSNGKLSLRRAGDSTTQQFEVDLLRKRTGVKVKVPF